MRRFVLRLLVGMVFLLGILPARADGSGWSILVSRDLVTEFPASGDLVLGSPMGQARAVYVIIRLVDPLKEGYARVYLLGQLAAECIANGGGVICSTRTIPITSSIPEGLEGIDMMTIEVESDVDYTLTVRALVAVPAPHVAFLPQIGR